MTSYMSPGVYVEEVPSGPQPIAAVSASTLAIIGATRRGPQFEPTRITGWGDFVARFGGPVAGGFTPDAVSGFFENGGQAVYVVRVDESTAARWMVRDSNDDDVFVIGASSAGVWADGLQVSISPDFSGGSGRLWSSEVTVTGADTVTVSSALGVRPGDQIETQTGNAVGTVQSVLGNVITMQANLANTPTAGEHVVLNQAAANPLRLVTANGIHVGDVIEVQVPGSPHQHARVDAIAVEGDGTALTLSPAIAATAGTVAPRTARFKAKLTAPNAAPTFDQLTWAETEPPGADSLLVDGFRAFLEDGRVAAWSTDHWELPGNDPIPPAKLEIEAQVSMRRFFEDVTLDHPTVADLNRRYGFFPDGTTLRLRPTAGALVDIPKVGDSFDDSGLAPGDLDRVFNRARFGPTNTGAGVLARAGRAPELGDRAAYGTVQTVTGVEALGGDVFFVTMTGATAVHDNDTPVVLSRFQNSRIVPLRFKVRVAGKGGVAEEYPNLALAGSHPRSYDRDGIVNGVSALIRVKSRLNPSPITEALLPARLVATAPGTSRPATANGMKRGFDTLELEPEPAMVICPDALTLDDPLAQADVIGWMVARCEEFRRFAIVDPPNETDDEELVQWRLDNVNSTNAAVYAPHVKILNLDPAAAERFRTVPPSGFVAGVFARTDRERGVHKAPANERMNGIFGLAVDYSQRRQDLLNPSGVNLIRKFPGRGRRIWGARNATDDTTWRYVNVRRLFNFVESSVERGTQWVVFEPNTANTWLRVRVTVENFLNQLWRAGALAGTSPEEAYRVRVGLGETMNESDIQLGLIVTEVAIAPAYPAEFVVFRFSHKRLSE